MFRSTFSIVVTYSLNIDRRRRYLQQHTPGDDQHECFIHIFAVLHFYQNWINYLGDSIIRIILRTTEI